MSIIEEAKEYLEFHYGKNFNDKTMSKHYSIINNLTKELEQYKQVVQAADKHINSFIPVKCLDILSYRELREALNQLSEVK